MATSATSPVASGSPPDERAAERIVGEPGGILPAPQQTAATAQIVTAVGVVLAICYFAQAVLITLIIAVLLAFMLDPVVRFLERMRAPRPVAAFLAVVVMLAGVYGMVYVSYNRAVDFVQQLPKYSGEIRETVLRFRRQAQQLQKTTETMLATPSTGRPAVRIYQESSWWDLLSHTGPVWEFLLFLSFVPVLVYFILTWQEHARKATVRLFDPEHRDAAYEMMGKLSEMIRGFIIGNLVIGLFLAVTSVIAFAILGLPYFYIVGVISGLVSLVPYLGVVLALVPPVVVGFGQIAQSELGIIVGVVIGLHLFALNVLYPKLLGSRLRLNPLAVTAALLFWGWLWGGIGLILAVPITGVMKIIFDHVERLRLYGEWLGES